MYCNCAVFRRIPFKGQNDEFLSIFSSNFQVVISIKFITLLELVISSLLLTVHGSKLTN